MPILRSLCHVILFTWIVQDAIRSMIEVFCCYILFSSNLMTFWSGCSALESNQALPWLMRPSVSTRHPPATVTPAGECDG